MKRLVRLQYNSPVVLTFALLSLAALLLDKFTGGWTTVKLFSVYRSPLTDILTYPRFVLHVLGHSGYSHYIGNMMMILVVGPPLEEKYGRPAAVCSGRYFSRRWCPDLCSGCSFRGRRCLARRASYS